MPEMKEAAYVRAYTRARVRVRACVCASGIERTELREVIAASTGSWRTCGQRDRTEHRVNTLRGANVRAANFSRGEPFAAPVETLGGTGHPLGMTASSVHGWYSERSSRGRPHGTMLSWLTSGR